VGVRIDVSAATKTTSVEQRQARISRPGFGTVFTDHMVSAEWTDGRWHNERVLPYGPLSLDPAAAGLHYGQSVFEGLRVFPIGDDRLGVFRPESHAARFRRSARRLMMPEPPDDLFMGAIEELVRLDRQWIPDDPAITLYLRPLLFATEPFIGLRPSRSYRFLLIACVAESLVEPDTGALSVWVSEDYSRAAPGGTGAAKCAGNYAAGYAAQLQAEEHGCDHVVWLDAVERSWVEETSAMNVFFLFDRRGSQRLVTPPLTGTLLPGITRDSVLTLAAELGLDTAEERVSIEDWRQGAEGGEITETFACGTAARINSIGQVQSPGGTWTIGTGGRGPVAEMLANRLRDVQHGLCVDRYGWMHVLGDARCRRIEDPSTRQEETK
jgi:branched-chain amino acid aminotransferase